MGRAPERNALVLSGPITVDTVPLIRPHLLEHLDIPGACVIDAAEVTELDADGAQLLAAFIMAIARRAEVVRWLSVSPRMLASARALGMTSWLELPEHP